MKFILASASPRRKELLRKILKRFSVIPSTVDESSLRAKTPEAFAVKAALAKALEVAKRHNNAIVIGADTIVVLKNKILGKPKDKKHAIAMLKSLSGTTHRVITGLAVVNGISGKTKTGYAVTKVRMKRINEEDILAYVKSGRPLDKAGGYGIQEIEDPFIEKIIGDYDNVVGLPVKKLEKMLSEALICRK
ncbi:MAG: Maf family protein [Candidatus Margulisbacteria bacterium]|nr:Maf family protein [Candidatus Margulisiibacteriota bacterium]